MSLWENAEKLGADFIFKRVFFFRCCCYKYLIASQEIIAQHLSLWLQILFLFIRLLHVFWAATVRPGKNIFLFFFSISCFVLLTSIILSLCSTLQGMAIKKVHNLYFLSEAQKSFSAFSQRLIGYLITYEI